MFKHSFKHSLTILLFISVVHPNANASIGIWENKLIETYVLDEYGRPRQALLELLDLFGIEHDGSLESIVRATQKNPVVSKRWIRPKGVERWDYVNESFEEKREQALPLLKRLGLMDVIWPGKIYYTYCLVHPNYLQGFRRTMAFLVHLWEQNVRFGDIAFIPGDRDLAPNIESMEQLLNNECRYLKCKENWSLPAFIERYRDKLTKECVSSGLPKNEADMMYMVYDQAILPEEFKNLCYFTTAPKKEDGRRPDTKDTIVAWRNKRRPKRGSCLFISQQSYVIYQDSIARTYLPSHLAVETVGPWIEDWDSHAITSIILDILTRLLYQETKRRELFENQDIASVIRNENGN